MFFSVVTDCNPTALYSDSADSAYQALFKSVDEHVVQQELKALHLKCSQWKGTVWQKTTLRCDFNNPAQPLMLFPGVSAAASGGRGHHAAAAPSLVHTRFPPAAQMLPHSSSSSSSWLFDG